MIKSILIPTDKFNYAIIKDVSNRVETTGQLSMPTSHGDKVEYYHIILIDTEQEIVEGDWCLYLNNETKAIQKKNVNKYGIIELDGSGYDLRYCYKIISSTNKSLQKTKEGIVNHSTYEQDLIPQPSPQSIQLLINYYNEHEEMPESVKIETYCAHGDDCPSKGAYDKQNLCDVQIKLNRQGEIDITVAEEKLYYCKASSKVLPCSHYYKDGRCLHPSHCNFKTEEKLYNKEEILEMLEQCDSEGGLRWDEVDKWLNTKKK